MSPTLFQLTLLVIGAFATFIAFTLIFMPTRTADLDDEDHE
jgi:hypothetical protein